MPALIIGAVGLTMLAYQATFDCKAGMGCYPYKCVYDEAFGFCHLNLREEDLDPGGHPLWFVPPPGLKCAYQIPSSNIFSRAKRGMKSAVGFAHNPCHLEACAKAESVTEAVGFFKADSRLKAEKDGKIPKDLNGTELRNCQPLSVKDMSAHQESTFLKALQASASSFLSQLSNSGASHFIIDGQGQRVRAPAHKR